MRPMADDAVRRSIGGSHGEKISSVVGGSERVLRVGVIADDLTGACDSGVAFLDGGRTHVGIWPWVPSGNLGCVAVSTESREAPPEVGRERTTRAARRLRGWLVYRKLDSMLRGNPLADVEGALAEGARAVIAPALPGEGRVTVDGVQRWTGGSADLHALFAPLGARAEIADAVTDADLDVIARRIVGSVGVVAAGSAGLAAALARALGFAPPGPGPRARCERVVAVVGTPAAAEQGTVARARGWEVVMAGPGDVPRLDDACGVLLTGGETASRVLRAHGACGLELCGEPLPRIPLARVLGGTLEGRWAMLKAGAFGGPDVIDQAMEVLSERSTHRLGG